MKDCPTCKRTFADHIIFCPFDGHPIVETSQSNSLIGSLIDGKYRLEEMVGKGGMGTVYRAAHLAMEITVAVKILHSHLASDHIAIERFRREARAAAQIRHPNVVNVMDFGVVEATGLAYFVMEFLEGTDLRERLNQKKQLAYDEAFFILNQVCAAVQAGHVRGFIHRDLKPDNIWLLKGTDGHEVVKILDYGIALPTLRADANTLTSPGMIVGTPYYMSPEQCRGETLDPRSDIYSLGVILYEMLTGQVPFRAPTPLGVVLKHNSEAPKPLRELRPDIPEAVEQAVLRALAKDKQNRQQHATELSEEFRLALEIDSSANFRTVLSPRPKWAEQAIQPSAPPPITTGPTANQPSPLLDKKPENRPNNVLLGQRTVHLNLTGFEPARGHTAILRHAEVFREDEGHVFEELVLHQDFERLWRSFIHAGGGRNLLTGYGPFGGTSLVQCAIAKARTELERLGQVEGALLVFYFRIANETAQGFEIEATDFGLGHLQKPEDLSYNSDLKELKERAHRNKASTSHSVMNLPLSQPLGKAFFNTPEDAPLAETEVLHPPMEKNYGFSQFLADLNAFFKQRKSDRALRRIVLRLVRSEYLPSRVVFIIDRVRHLETLESLFKSEMFSNRRIRVIAVARKENFDSWQNADARLEAIDFSKWYVPSLWEIEWGKSLFDLVSEQNAQNEKEFQLVSEQSAQNEKGFQLFLNHLMYIGRGSLGNIIAELRHPINTTYGDRFSFVDIDRLSERAEVQHNAWLQDVLDLNWDTILATLFGGRDEDEKTDRARVGIYHLLDWISHKTRFTESAILEVSGRLPITISDDQEINVESIQNLLYVLLRNRYISLHGQEYRLIWSKHKKPKYRKVKIRQKEKASGLLQKKAATDSQIPLSGHLQAEDPIVSHDTNAQTATGVLTSTPLSCPGASSALPPVETALLDSSVNLLDAMPMTRLITSTAPPRKNKVFVSYSREDREWLKRLRIHLKPLEHEGIIDLWDDTRIKAGTKWRQEIETAIASAKVATLLVSASFLASDFIQTDELLPLLTASIERGTKIIPIIVSPCMYQQSKLSSFQAVNDLSLPLSGMNRTQREELFVRVAESILDALP